MADSTISQPVSHSPDEAISKPRYAFTDAWRGLISARAAAKLGLKRTTLLAKMTRLGISRPISQEGTSVPGAA